MSYPIIENVVLEMPNVSEQVHDVMQESVKTSKKLITEIAAIHEGLTANFNYYSAEELEKSVATWLTPYPKPIILNHDPETEPLGRAMAASMKQEDGKPYIALQCGIMSPNAIEKVLDQRYLTGSVGGSSAQAICSICGTDWAKPQESAGMPCKHQRGRVYNGKLAYLERKGIVWKEYSFVNVPSDSTSGIRNFSMTEAETNEDNHSFVKVFSLDMDNENILEFKENSTPVNVLEKMKKKEAHFTYMNLKGTFLSVSAYDFKETELETENLEKSNFIQIYTTIDNEAQESGNSSTQSQEATSDQEENEMAETEIKVTEEGEEDILDVTAKLSDDLSASAQEAAEPSDTEAPSEELSEEISDVEPDSEEVVSEDEDKAEDSDKVTEEETEVAEETDELSSTSDENLNAKEQVQDADQASTVEAEIEELRQVNEALKEENAKLKKALHFGLAERVVDAKISLGLVALEERAEALEEHRSRSASSLADNLRDLSRMPHVAVVTESKPTLETKLTPLSEKNTQTEGAVIEEKKVKDPTKAAEDILVNMLLNKKFS